jgi:hypothetical protein
MGMYYDLYTVSDAQAQDLLNNPETIHTFLEIHDADYDSPTSLSLEKCWHGIHFALTHTAWEGEKPLNFLMAGETVGDVDIGYGPARILFSEDVLHIEEALAEFTEQDFDRNFDVIAMEEAEIYPQIWDEPRADLLAEYQSHFQALKQFIRYSAENKKAIVMTVK